MKRYEHYIFDLDNTLVDSRKGYEEAFIVGFREFDIPYDPELYSEYIRLPLSQIFSQYHPNSPRKCKEFVSAIMEIYDETCLNNVRLFPDAERCIDRLVKEGCVLGIVSNAFLQQITDILAKLRIDDLFVSVVGRDRVAFPKPDPEPVLLCMSEMSATKENTMMVGDSVNDVLAAKGAGLFTALVCREGENVTCEECDMIIESLDEI